jgi:hypothetical protein
MKRNDYLKPECRIVYFAPGESVCIATGSGGTGEALSKGNDVGASSEWDDSEDKSN